MRSVLPFLLAGSLGVLGACGHATAPPPAKDTSTAASPRASLTETQRVIAAHLARDPRVPGKPIYVLCTPTPTAGNASVRCVTRVEPVPGQPASCSASLELTAAADGSDVRLERDATNAAGLRIWYSASCRPPLR